MVVSWQLLSQSLIPLASCLLRGNKVSSHSLLWPNHWGPMSQELKWQTCFMWSQPHERLWPPLLKLNLEMVGKLVSAAVAVVKSSIPVFNSNSNSRDFNSNSIFNSTNFNYANPVYSVATICHQVRWVRWGHPSLFHTATSLLIWYKMFCVRDISYRLIWMEFINMLSVYAQSGTHSRFNW